MSDGIAVSLNKSPAFRVHVTEVRNGARGPDIVVFRIILRVLIPIIVAPDRVVRASADLLADHLDRPIFQSFTHNPAGAFVILICATTVKLTAGTCTYAVAGRCRRSAYRQTSIGTGTLKTEKDKKND